VRFIRSVQKSGLSDGWSGPAANVIQVRAVAGGGRALSFPGCWRLGHGGGGRKPGHRCAQATAPATYHGGVPWHRATEATGFQRLSWSFFFLEKVCGKPLLPLPGFGSRCFLRQHTEADAGPFSAKLTCRSSGQPRVFRLCDGTAQRDGFEPNPVTCPPAIPPVPRSASGRRTGVPGTGNGSNGFPESFLSFCFFSGEGWKTRCRRCRDWASISVCVLANGGDAT